MDKEQNPLTDHLPQQISEGMTVYDRNNQVVGTVQVVYFGGASQEAIERALESAESSSAESAFDANEVTQEMRRRMMENGYVLLQGPDLAGARRYLTPEHIEEVFSEEVEGAFTQALRLRVTLDELLNT
jgi:hypothetical protein